MSEVFSVELPPVRDQLPVNSGVDLSNLQLVEHTDPILKTPLSKFNFSNPPVDPIELAHALVDVMKKFNGLGLSANQVGLPYRVFAMTGEPNFVCYNPVLVGHGDETSKDEEGCLSYPFLFVDVKRWKSIKVRFTMPNGDTTTKVFGGLTARIFQHELSHMDGIIPLAEASQLDLKFAIDKTRRRFKVNYYPKHLRNES